MSPDPHRCCRSTASWKRFGGFRALDGLTLHVAPAKYSAWSVRTGRAKPRASTSFPGCTGRTDGTIRFERQRNRRGSRRIKSRACRHQPNFPGAAAVSHADGARECRDRNQLWPQS